MKNFAPKEQTPFILATTWTDRRGKKQSDKRNLIGEELESTFKQFDKEENASGSFLNCGWDLKQTQIDAIQERLDAYHCEKAVLNKNAVTRDDGSIGYAYSIRVPKVDAVY